MKLRTMSKKRGGSRNESDCRRWKKRKGSFSAKTKSEPLPWDILYDIWARLPAKSLIRFKCTSKEWYVGLSDPKFADLHLSRASECPGYLCATAEQVGPIEDNIYFVEEVERIIEEPKLLGVLAFHFTSSGGLIAYCCWDRFYICNPTIGEQIEVPVDSTFTRTPGQEYVSWGFGYSMSTKEYKIVKIGTPCHPEANPLVAVCTLGSESWRKLSWDTFYPPPTQSSLGESFDSQVECKGTLFWMITNSRQHRVGPQNILSFDLVSEKFGLLPEPPFVVSNRNRGDPVRRIFNVFETIGYAVRDKCSRISIWVLRDKENAVWINEYSFTCGLSVPGGVNFIGIWMRRYLSNAANSLQSQGTIVFTRTERGFLESIVHFIPHVESLVSPFNIMPMAKRNDVRPGRLVYPVSLYGGGSKN